MDKCPKCGNKLSSIDVLCPKCGKLVDVIHVAKSTGHNVPSGPAGPAERLAPQTSNAYIQPDAAATAPGHQSAHRADRISELLESDEINELLKIFDEPNSPDSAAFSAEPEQESDENYLAMFRNKRLPEVEDISTHITEHAERAVNSEVSAERAESSAHNAVPTQAQPSEQPSKSLRSDTDENAKRRWLELEEFSDITPDAASFAAEPDMEEELAEETPRYRYRRERHPAAAKPSVQPQRGAGRMVLIVFSWLLLTAALFVGFFFFDKYVTEHYGSYPAMLYEWSNGNINLNPSDALSPTPPETPGTSS